MSAFSELTNADAAALAARLGPFLHPLAQQLADLEREEQALPEEIADLEQNIAARRPAAEAATATHQATHAEILALSKREEQEKDVSRRLWSPIEDMTRQKRQLAARLKDIPALKKALQDRIAAGTTIRPRP